MMKQFLEKKEERSRCEQQPQEMLGRTVLSGESTGRPEFALWLTEDDDV